MPQPGVEGCRLPARGHDGRPGPGRRMPPLASQELATSIVQGAEHRAMIRCGARPAELPVSAGERCRHEIWF